MRAVLLYPKIKKRHGRSRKEIEEFLNKALRLVSWLRAGSILT